MTSPNPLALLMNPALGMQAQSADESQIPQGNPLAAMMGVPRPISPAPPTELETEVSRLKGDIQRDENDPTHNILRGMLERGMEPEQFTKGQIARNALANFARGILQGRNFRSVEDEIYERKQQEFNSKLATVRAMVAEKKAAASEKRQLLLGLLADKSRQEANAIKQQQAETQMQRAKTDELFKAWQMKNGNILTGEAVKTGEARRDLMGAQSNLTQARAEWEMMANADPQLRMNPEEQVMYLIRRSMPANATPEQAAEVTKKAYQFIQESQKLSRYAPSSSADQMGPLDPQTKAYYARYIRVHGGLPYGMTRGLGKEAIREIAVEAAHSAAPGENAAVNRQLMLGQGRAYREQLAKRDSIAAYEKMVKKNMDVFLELAPKIPDTGVPWLNVPIRQVNEKLLGDEYQAAFKAARLIDLNELARATMNPNLTGVITEDARREIQALSPEGATLKQMIAVAKILRRDLDNRIVSLDEVLEGRKEAMNNILGDKETEKPIPSTRAVPTKNEQNSTTPKIRIKSVRQL
jgi:hypothetical protein